MLKSVLSVCVTGVVLVGCGVVSPAGLVAAARLDPLGTPPGDISVAISVPDALRLSDGDATLYLAFAPDDPDIAAPIATTVPLSISDETGPRAPAPGEAIYVFGFSASAAAQLSAVQDQITSLKRQDVAGKGTLSIGVGGGCLTRALDARLPVTTWLRTDPAAEFVSLTRSADLLDVLPPDERRQLEAELTPC